MNPSVGRKILHRHAAMARTLLKMDKPRSRFPAGVRCLWINLSRRDAGRGRIRQPRNVRSLKEYRALRRSHNEAARPCGIFHHMCRDETFWGGSPTAPKGGIASPILE